MKDNNMSSSDIGDAFPHEDVDLYGESELRNALARNQSGQTVLGELATKVVAEGSSSSNTETQRQVKESLSEALSEWSKYYDLFDGEKPRSLVELQACSPHIMETALRLEDVKEELLYDFDETIAGRNVAFGMQQVLLPWDEFRRHLGVMTFTGWLDNIRKKQGFDRPDYIRADLREYLDLASALKQPIYFDGGSGDWLTLNRYLDRKVEQDGPWGVMLMQAGAEAGTDNTLNHSAADLTNQGTDTLRIGGHNVGAMGIFEWLSLTIQQTPNAWNTYEPSLLLANLYGGGGEDRVPVAYIDYNEQDLSRRICVESRSAYASGNSMTIFNYPTDVGPRLAVA